MQRGRRIAFDYGDVRIGVAVSDPDSILASPLTTLKSDSKSLPKEILAIFEEIEPVQIFVGKPALLSDRLQRKLKSSRRNLQHLSMLKS